MEQSLQFPAKLKSTLHGADMKEHFTFCIIMTLILGACVHDPQQQKHYYVGQHKYHQLQYSIHEDHGYPFDTTNKKSVSHKYRTQYKANGEQRQL